MFPVGEASNLPIAVVHLQDEDADAGAREFSKMLIQWWGRCCLSSPRLLILLVDLGFPHCFRTQLTSGSATQHCHILGWCLSEADWSPTEDGKQFLCPTWQVLSLWLCHDIWKHPLPFCRWTVITLAIFIFYNIKHLVSSHIHDFKKHTISTMHVYNSFHCQNESFLLAQIEPSAIVVPTFFFSPEHLGLSNGKHKPPLELHPHLRNRKGK